MNYETLDALIESRRDEFLGDLERWLAIPSVQGEACPGRALWRGDLQHAEPGAGDRPPLRV